MSIKVCDTRVKALDLETGPATSTQCVAKSTLVRVRSRVANQFTHQYDQRGDQSTCPISDVVLLTSLGLAGHSQLCGVGTTANACIPFFSSQRSGRWTCFSYIIGAAMYNSGIFLDLVHIEVGSSLFDHEHCGADSVGLHQVLQIVTELMAKSWSIPVDQVAAGRPAPPGGGTILLVGSTTGGRIEPYRGIRRRRPQAAADLADRPIRPSGSGFATPRRCGNHTETQRRSGGSGWSSAAARRRMRVGATKDQGLRRG